MPFLAKRAPVAASRALRELRRRCLARSGGHPCGGSRRVTQLKIWVVPCATATLNWRAVEIDP